jgi:hypothetical protein
LWQEKDVAQESIQRFLVVGHLLSFSIRTMSLNCSMNPSTARSEQWRWT